MVSVDSKIAPIKTLEWENACLISKVELREQGKGHTVAYVHAAERAESDHEQLFALREEFKRKGWATSSDNHHGRAVLRVTGIENEKQLTDLLQSNHAVEGPARQSQADVAGQDSKGIADFIKSNSLRASGLFYMLGDVLFIKSGLVRDKNKKLGQMGMGISFAVGDAALMAFGGRDDRRQFKSLLTKLKKHLDTQGVEIPQGMALTSETLSKPGGLLETTYDFLHEHINPIKIAAEIVGGGFCLKAGLDQKNKFKVASGVVIMTGWIASLLLHEKKRDPEEWKEAGTLEKAKMYLQEKPLRLAGWAGLAHNAIYTAGAFSERSKTLGTTDHYKWDMAATATMLVANSLYSICSKTTGGNIKTDALVNDVYGIAAQILNRQPEAIREKAIESTVAFLGSRPEIKDTKEEISQRLRQEIETQSQNPWFKAIRKDGRNPNIPSPAVSHVSAVNKSRDAGGNQTSLV